MPGESGVVPRLEAVFAVIPLKRNPKTGCSIANSQCNGPAEPPPSAREVGHKSARLFVNLVRQHLEQNVSQAQGKRARRVLVRFRELRPEGFPCSVSVRRVSCPATAAKARLRQATAAPVRSGGSADPCCRAGWSARKCDPRSGCRPENVRAPDTG